MCVTSTVPTYSVILKVVGIPKIAATFSAGLQIIFFQGSPEGNWATQLRILRLVSRGSS